MFILCWRFGCQMTDQEDKSSRQTIASLMLAREMIGLFSPGEDYTVRLCSGEPYGVRAVIGLLVPFGREGILRFGREADERNRPETNTQTKQFCMEY